MKFLLDTNAIIALLKGNERLHSQLRRHQPQDFAISAIVAHELFYGAYKSQRAVHNLGLVESLQFQTLEFDLDDARHAGELRAKLARSGNPIGPYDVLVAGQALARSLTLITRNVREFQRVERLNVENWED
ncbi:type II toxin-antitoxin system VapC family toxin [Phyllobacterium myrsinacearum]|uniref:Ribonuclease VapC n=1 Tax=Phyllobacterium myrsinacearum TaxID=28101 RepID=A0A2S9JCK5_9HYPH|nr:type II toxin-antitoxin system VapC family toxin [Phyllobacterium myrsinacearum]PRD50558.1 VapC toxin family PIN domain ribonuclease [Phyllobacterium myrsinacearum]PWV94894.1 tRNA(fMet)-specific endonuclease VapC [Phyllobacterium myrsinacearum]RZV06995.1 tRNA(fMet)-specific endonuclease VapC [Phyllobacterium myrsinacearum]